MSGQIAAVDMFMFCPSRFTVLIRLSFLLAGCAQSPQSCPSNTPIGIIAADNIAADDSLPFRLPLDESSSDGPHFFTLGELIAYLGDADENDGSVQHPLEPISTLASAPVSALITLAGGIGVGRLVG